MVGLVLSILHDDCNSCMSSKVIPASATANCRVQITYISNY